MRQTLTFAFALLSLISLAISQVPTAPVLQSDFQRDALGALPENAKILSGEFAVKEDGINRFLELSPVPLNSFGVLLGPERGADTSIRARVRSTPTGKRFPEFGIGLGGVGGYRIWLMPAVQELQLKQGDKVLQHIPFQWKSDAWTHLHLHVRATAEGRWLISGKAWMEGDPEPAEWMIRHEPAEKPPSGRASLWGTPYSEKSIQFDDVRVDPL